MSCHVIYHIISYHIISYHIISYHIISYHIWYDMIYDMVRNNDMIWYMIWSDMIWSDMIWYNIIINAIGLSPGGSGYITCIQNMKLVTNKLKSEGLLWLIKARGKNQASDLNRRWGYTEVDLSTIHYEDLDWSRAGCNGGLLWLKWCTSRFQRA